MNWHIPKKLVRVPLNQLLSGAFVLMVFVRGYVITVRKQFEGPYRDVVILELNYQIKINYGDKWVSHSWYRVATICTSANRGG